MTRTPSHLRRWTAVFCMLLLVTSCGDDDDAAPADDVAPSSDDSTEPSTSPEDDAADASDSDAGDEASASAASGSVTVDGATYAFTDVRECEVGGDTWGPEWRTFTAFDESGHNFVSITHAASPDDWMTSFDLSVGLTNAGTLDEGNPDQEWTTAMGGSLAVTLTDTGAEGSADVTNLDVVEGAVDATASWSFSC